MQINAGNRITQLLLFPYIKGKIAPVGRTRAFGSTEKCVFWARVVNDQKPQLIVQMQMVEIQSLVNTGAYVSILSHKSWNPKWPFLECLYIVYRNW